MKTPILTLSLYILFCQVKGQWSDLASLPSEGRLGVMHFEINDDIYVLGGTRQVGASYVGYDELWQYNHSEDAWQSKPNIPGGGVFGGFSFIMGQTAYVGLGADENGTYKNSCWSYNEASGWTEIAAFPGQLRVYPFSIVKGDSAIIGCGQNGNTPLSDCWLYDRNEDEWTQVSDYNGGGRVGLASFQAEGRSFVGLGDDGNSYYDVIYEYKFNTDTWIPLSSFPGNTRSFSGCASSQYAGFIAGGEDLNTSLTNEVWQFVPSTNKWTALENFTGQSRRYGVLFHSDTALHFGLGQVGFSDDQVTNDFWELPLETPDIPEGTSEKIPVDKRVYPNPFDHTLHLPNTSTGNSSITIFNAKGQVMHTGQVGRQIDTKKWPPQVYFVRMESTHSVSVIKTIKY